MATEAQINANWLNAQKATGLKTETGRARSRQNAFKTGIDSKSEVMSTESMAEHEQLIAPFHARFNAGIPEEESLVDGLIRHEWPSRRYIAIEAALWTRRMNEIDERSMGRVFMALSQQISRASQIFQAARRGFVATLKHLRETQTLRKAGEAATQSAEIATDTKPLTSELVSLLRTPFEAQLMIEDDPPLAA